MKTISVIIASGILSLNALAGNGTPSSIAPPNKYCAKMKDGKITVMQEGNILTTETTLANGTRIKTDGTVVKKDGSQVMLSEGMWIRMGK